MLEWLGMHTLLEHLKRRRQEAMRWAVLVMLANMPQYKAPTNVLCDTLADCGLAVSQADLAAELTWLASAGLIAMQQVDGSAYVVQLLEAGSDVAHGLVALRGIRQPPPHRPHSAQ